MANHPRLRFDENDDLWIMMPRREPGLVVSKYGVGETADLAFAHEQQFHAFAEVQLTDEIMLRQAAPYSFDIGYNEADEPEMRYAYGYLDTAGHVQIQVGYCDYALAACDEPQSWSTQVDYPSDYHLFPSLRYARVGAEHAWMLSWVSTAEGDGGQVAVWAANVTNAGFRGRRRFTLLQEPCPFGSGYWGDYDEMGFNPLRQTFVRPFTDSTGMTCTSEPSISRPHNVGVVSIGAVLQ
jgi:hypothetical protein